MRRSEKNVVEPEKKVGEPNKKAGRSNDNSPSTLELREGIKEFCVGLISQVTIAINALLDSKIDKLNEGLLISPLTLIGNTNVSPMEDRASIQQLDVIEEENEENDAHDRSLSPLPNDEYEHGNNFYVDGNNDFESLYANLLVSTHTINNTHPCPYAIPNDASQPLAMLMTREEENQKISLLLRKSEL
jgi:hypothetical protein